VVGGNPPLFLSIWFAARRATFCPRASEAGGAFGRPSSVVLSLILRRAGFFMTISLGISTNSTDLSSKQRVSRHKDRASDFARLMPFTSAFEAQSLLDPQAQTEILNSRSAESRDVALYPHSPAARLGKAI
jgi:hypothetical protein